MSRTTRAETSRMAIRKNWIIRFSRLRTTRRAEKMAAFYNSGEVCIEGISSSRVSSRYAAHGMRRDMPFFRACRGGGRSRERGVGAGDVAGTEDGQRLS